MDGCRVRPSRSVTPQKLDRVENTSRPPLGLSDKNNGIPFVCKPRTREIPSRYKTSQISSSRQRFPSPIVGPKLDTQHVQLPKRAQSADRRSPSNCSSTCSRPLMPSSSFSKTSTSARDSLTEICSTSRLLLTGKAPDGLWPSVQRLSNTICADTSIKGRKFGVVNDSCADHVFKTSGNAVPDSKKTLWGRSITDLSEIDRPMEDLPGRTVDELRWSFSKERMSFASTSSSSTDPDGNGSKSKTLATPLCQVLSRRTQNCYGLDREQHQLKSGTEWKSSLVAHRQLNYESCLGVTSTSCISEKVLPVTTPGTPSPVPRLAFALPLNKTLSASSSTSNPRTDVSAPEPSPFNYFFQVRKGKKSAKHLEDAHQQRVLYNRYLQWHFINALAEEALSSQRRIAESTLFKVENITSQLSGLIIRKRILLQHIKQDAKLSIILKEQIAYLEDWATVENEHCSSLSGTIRALEATTLRIPVTGLDRVDIRAMKSAINSAMDVMQAMSSLLNYLICKLEHVLFCASELLTAARKERAILDKCAELLALAEWLQVQESSLRVHMMQLGRNP